MIRLQLWFFSLVTVILLLFTGDQVHANPLYEKQIIHEPIKNEYYERSLADLKKYLELSTSSLFTARNGTTAGKKGIYVLLNKTGLINSSFSSRLQNGSIEDFVIQGNADRLLLIANHPLGLSRAIYTYLDQLGFRWYLPGDEWQVLPQRSSIKWNESRYITPSFSLRDFSGTGGILPVKSLDPGNDLAQKWEDWKRRNRMGGEYQLAGHYGETFNIKYQELLQKNSSYLGQVNGQRNWSASAKWCISNKAFRELFIADRVGELEQRLTASAYPNEKIVLTVDPADGYGDCECDACRKMGSPNDRTYFLANETAIALKKKSSRAFANIYAYNTHPSPPPFALSDNLIVQLIPYAFQTVAKPEVLIESWKKRHGNLLVYDYYGIPDWHYDTPLSDGWSIENFFKRLPFWKKNHLSGFHFESSYSSANTGLGLYSAARYGWNESENIRTVKEAFLKTMFGDAAPAISLFHEKLQNNFGGAADLPFLIDQLQKATNAVSDRQVRQRLTQLKAYVHYLVLYYQLKAGTANKQQALENLSQYLLEIYPRGVVHSTYLTLLFYQQFENAEKAKKDWHLFEPFGKMVQKTRFLNDKEIEELFLKDARSYPLLKGFPYLSQKSKTDYRINDPKSENLNMKEGLMILGMPQTLVKPSAKGEISFTLKVNEGSENNLTQTISLSLQDTAAKQEIAVQKVGIDKNWRQVNFKVPVGRTYRLTITNPNWIRISVPPTQWFAFENIPTYAVLGKLWFYNEASSFLYFTNANNDAIVYRDKKGNVLKIENANEQGLFRVALQPRSWYSIEGTQYKTLQFYNKDILFFPYLNMSAN